MRPPGPSDPGIILGPEFTPSSEGRFVECTDVERETLLFWIRDKGYPMAKGAVDSLRNTNDYVDEKFRQYFSSRYSDHKAQVHSWYLQYLDTIATIADRMSFQVQCHGGPDQCVEDIYALTDFSKQSITLVRILIFLLHATNLTVSSVLGLLTRKASQAA